MEKIDLVLYLLVSLIALHVLGVIFRTYSGWFRNGEKLYNFIHRQLSKGEIDSALSSCESHLVRRPHDGQLMYYRAKALYKLGRNEEALKAFGDLKVSDPAWSEDAEKYIQVIKSAT